VRLERARLITELATMPGLLTRADETILELTAAALAEYHQAVRVLVEQGASYECKTATGSVMRRARPEQAIADQAWRRAVAGIRELGLSPAARTRIDVEPPAQPPHPDSLASFRAQRFFDKGPTIDESQASRQARPSP